VPEANPAVVPAGERRAGGLPTPTGQRGPLGHGIDIEEIEALPQWRQDPAANAFYSSHFTPGELKTAEARPDPRAHLCGIWCAKEAVKKSDPALLTLDFRDIQVTNDAAGRPCVRFERQEVEARFVTVVSISHSRSFAVGSAITLLR